MSTSSFSNHKFLSIIGLLALVFLLNGPASLAQSLPNGLEFQHWDDATNYKRIYHVAQAHPEASDKNPGTEAAPFRTISRAAELLKPGEKVIIHSGIYREFVQPERGGKDAKSMIAYEAAKGEEVIISGAVPIGGNWEQSIPEGKHKMSLLTWQISLDSVLDNSVPNPFNQPNATHQQMKIMHWATHLTGTVPYVLPRGMVFQKGKRLTHLAHWEDLFRVDGAYWVDTVRNMLHVNPFGYVKPADAELSLTALEQLFCPKEIATSYIKIKGITFECAGNGFMRTAVGAVFVNGGNHWIFEDNVIRKVNSVGLEIGTKFTEGRKITSKENKLIQRNQGGVIVRRNEIYDCGTGGIQGLRNFDALVSENHLHHIGWQDTEYYWECAAVKLLVNRRTLVEKNRIHDVASANAIWLDWDNINSRIASNLIYDIYPASGGAIYVEASRKTPNWIDHNILWKVADIGISVYDSDSVQVFNNLIAKTRLPYISKVNTKGRKVDGRLLTSVANILRYNIFYENEQLPFREDSSNKAFDNVFAGEDFERFQEQNWGVGNLSFPMEISFAPDRLQFNTALPLPMFSMPEPFLKDIRAYLPAKQQTSPGPFNVAGKGQLSFDLEAMFPRKER